MVKEAYIRGFLSKLAQYGIDPSAIYGNYTIDTSDSAHSEIPDYSTSTDIPSHRIGFGRQKSGFMPKILPLLGRFAYNQYSRHRGGPSFLTFGRRF